MGKGARGLRLSEEQVLWFRARRGHLAREGAADAAAAARALLGAQAQQEPPALLALSQRVAGRPSAGEVRARLLEPPRTLVRTWGQRDTLHVYHPEDWPLIVALADHGERGSRRGAMPPEKLVDAAEELLEGAGRPLTREDFYPLLPRDYVREAETKVAQLGQKAPAALRLAAGRLIWRLAHRGGVCLAHKRGSEQSYAARSFWLPDLEWPALRPREAGRRLARRYLAVHGPSTAADLAHFFGDKVARAHGWLDELEERGELIAVRCGERKGLRALEDDAAELAARPPRGAREWPLRLLPLWDTLLMSHADKSWTVPEAIDRPLVWRKAAMVAAAVLARGRIVATWKQKKRRRRLEIAVSPLSGWRASYLAGVRREARAVAAHSGLDEAEVTLAER